MTRMFLLLGALLLVAAPLTAQQQKAQPPGKGEAAAKGAAPRDAKGAPAAADEVKLVFEREVYAYPGAAGRRDPFRPLTGRNDAGPMFNELKLRSIVYMASAPARSIATVVDGSNKAWRVRRGDVVGNATVVDVGPQRVLFAVEDFGVRRQEVLQMKPTTGRGRTR